MGAPEAMGPVAAWRGGDTALAACLLALSRFAEHPEGAQAQRIVCLLDCLAEDPRSDAATRALAALLAQRWLYRAEVTLA